MRLPDRFGAVRTSVGQSGSPMGSPSRRRYGLATMVSGFVDCKGGEMSDHAQEPRGQQSLELPVEEVLRRARPLPPRDEMVIDDLSDEEGEAFLAELGS